LKGKRCVLVPRDEPVGVWKLFEERCAEGNRLWSEYFFGDIQQARITGNFGHAGTAHGVTHACSGARQGFFF
jgi:hypothetical protein